MRYQLFSVVNNKTHLQMIILVLGMYVVLREMTHVAYSSSGDSITHQREYARTNSAPLPPLLTDPSDFTVAPSIFGWGNKPSTKTKKSPTHKLAIGIFSVERTDAPDYVYAEVASILDALFTGQKYIEIDKIHVFDGTFNKTGSQVKLFKYSKHVEVHLMENEDYEQVRNFPVHRKASLNYLLALKYLVKAYNSVDAYLILEDDVIFDPDSALILWKTLNKVKSLPLFLVDGYVKGPVRDAIEEQQDDPVIPFVGDARCCSQAFLMSPKAVQAAIPHIENSLNGSEEYHPLDVFLTSSLLKMKDFHFYFAKKCWVQHVGQPHLGLGIFHRGCSRMEFEG